jgi:NADPH-dependent glutamate synthase beta subunit-like oxidoreductase
MTQATAPVLTRPWEIPAPAVVEPALARLAGEILERCRGEGPANCVARCPLHVDARGYVRLASEGRFREALQLVREKLPFPGILGYVCAHPCEQHCKRIETDAAVRIRDIKRFLAEWEPGPPAHVLDRDPERPKRVAVVGSGPAGLLAAHDLRRRGYPVEIFERRDRIGGCLAHQIPSWRLPPPVIDRDLSIVSDLGIQVHLGVEIGAGVTMESLRHRFAAVLLLTGYGGAVQMLRHSSSLRASRRETIAIDPLTGETGLEGVFAAGDAVSGPSTVIHALADGRRAAESARRFMAGEDLREGRESPLPRRLLWNFTISEAERRARERTPVMLGASTPVLSAEDVRTEAGRCLDCQCGLCVKDCEFLAKHCRSPKDLARRVLAGVDAVDTRAAVYSCNICELCSQVCPEGLDTGRLMLEARRESVRRGLGPLPQHKPIVGYWKAGVSGPFTLAMGEPGRRRARRLFFTGCALPAVAPARTLRVYDELRRHYPGMGVLMWCCGAPAELLGMEEAFHTTRDQILRAAEQLGAEELVAACPDCMHTLKGAVPELAITTLWERLAGQWSPPARRQGVVVSIHDSCKARHQDGLHAAVRQLVRDGGAVVEEIEYNHRLARCCGFGGMIAPVDPALQQSVTRRRAAESSLPMLTYCAGCRTALAGCGKESLHVLDFLLADDWREEIARKPPGALPRYFNRLRTKWAFKRLRPLAAEAQNHGR